MTEISSLHKPVLLERCIEVLGEALNSDSAILVDGTLGLGGHSEAFLQRFPKLTLVGIDRDENALKLAGERLAPFADRIHLVQAVYSEIPEVLEELGLNLADAVLLDLGVSSMQLDERDRGFAYSFDAPLDMRMDKSADLTAAVVLNEYAEADLADIFKSFGEERYAKLIAKQIVKVRSAQPFAMSKQLTDIIAKIVPFIPGKSSGHPAKRVFQALRIEVNSELEILAETIPAVIESLRIGGRVVVLSYQSLEDRIVKQALVAASTSSAPIELPIELEEHAPVLRLVVRGAEKASEQEIQENPRSASVRLRAAEKIRKAA
ncbi:MAG: 16S rRNA (cytosine(1402)-N(4))-methyltransferase RsmH [Rhodoluna sp.]|jgi:16S rRNA (cytosine1402-N4)-methyltransferase|nr:16S rRNA (cytosine(1402)-N(4))-methyltransferase RsmH [Rhodoluna sp.]